MAQPTTRPEFKEWCLRKLGKPVIEINVDDDQIEDRIDESLSYYYDYHFDGAEKNYVKHMVTQEDKDNGWLPVPENVIGVINVFPINNGLASSGMFSARYQFMLNNIADMSQYSMTNYYMSMQHIAFMEEILSGKKPIRYNRHVNKLFIDTAWKSIEIGEYIVYECYSVIDPEEFPDVWKDRWLQQYTTAKIKFQWGSNLTKFVGMNLPGNVQFNGEKILQDAFDEITKLETDMILSYSLPVTDMIG